MWVKVRRDALSLADAISLLPPGGQSSACSAQDVRREFSHALPVRAVDGQRERERERDGGRGRGGHTDAETINDCGVLWVS